MGSSILSRKRPRSRRRKSMSAMGKLTWGLLLLVLGLHLLVNTSHFVVGTVLVAVALPILLVAITTKPLCLPPGPKGVPFLGYLPFLTELPHQHLAELTHKFGPLVYFQLGSTPAILIASPAMMEVLMPQDQVFAARPAALLSSKYFAYTPNEPLGPVRRLYTMEMVSAKRFEYRNFKASRAAEMQTMVRTLWADSVGGSKSLDLRSTTFLPMANNIVTYMLSRHHRWGEEVQTLVSDVVCGCGSVSLASFFPILRPLTAWISGKERRMAAAEKRMDAYLQSLLDASREHPTTSDAEKTLVDVVLEFERDDGAALDDQTRKCVLLQFILSATEIVVTMVEWTMAELFRNPEVMHKVQSELHDVVGTLRFVEEEDLPNLPYLATLFQETSRLHPPSPLLFPHQITRQTHINGYDIPPHSRIILNTWAIGRDSKMWDNPKDYKPERFMDNINKKGDYKGQSLNFLPFGASGSNIPLEYNVVMLALGYLCQSFEWTLPKGMDPKMIGIEERFGLACTMKQPLQSHHIKPRLELYLYAPP